MAAKIRKGDKVIVLNGRDKGRTGEVFEVRPDENKALVRGVNLVKRHQKQSQAQEGGIISKESPIHLSNIAIEADHRTVGAADVLAHANDDRLHDVALLHLAARDRLLDRHHDDVANGGVATLGAAKHLDTHDTACTGIIGHVEVGLHLNH